MRLSFKKKRIKIIKGRNVYRLLAALLTALCLLPATTHPTAALDIDDYFSIDFNIEFNQNQIVDNKPFSATVTGMATCLQALPLTVSDAIVTGKVIAKHQQSGGEIILNPGYTISIASFPNDVGTIIESSQTVVLQFPEGSPPGLYDVFGELIEAKVKAILWFNVTSYLPSSQEMGTISYKLPVPGSEEDEQPFFGITFTDGSIDDQGIITEAVIAPSRDNNCIVNFNEGTKALDNYGLPLSRIRIYELKDPPPPPDNCLTIGLVYDIKPDGAIFKPPAMLTIAYEDEKVPLGISEERLVLATWDEDSRQWIELEDCIVDPLANTISAPISHFSAFCAMAHTAPPSFTMLELAITPQEVDGGDEVSISATVVNSGDLEGSYELILKIDNGVEQSRQIILPGKSSDVVSFVVSRDNPSLYSVNLNGLLGSFVVLEEIIEQEITPPAFIISGLAITPQEVDGGDEVSISATVVNSGDLEGSYELILKIDNGVEQSRQIILPGKSSDVVSFVVSRDNPSLYSVNLNGLLGSFVVLEEIIEQEITPPAFIISGLAITPQEVDGGDEVSISATVVNSGDLEGSYELILKIDNGVEQSRQIILPGKSSDVVSFVVSRDNPSLYSVNLNGLLGSFVVLEEIIEQEEGPQGLTASTLPPAGTNWWLISSIYMADAVLFVFIIWFIRRRIKAKKTAKKPFTVYYDLPLDEGLE